MYLWPERYRLRPPNSLRSLTNLPSDGAGMGLMSWSKGIAADVVTGKAIKISMYEYFANRLVWWREARRR